METEKETENSENEIIEEYTTLKEKYKLPNFTSLAEDFDIEKISEKDSSFLIREIRRVMNDKISSYLQLFETLLNPSSPPMFVFSLLKGLNEGEKDDIKKIYKILAKLQLKIMKLDTIYSEKDEANFVKESFDEWQTLKTKIYKIADSFEKNFDMENDSKQKGYFG